MRYLGLPIWIGEFGPLYNGTLQQAEERYQLLQDQLDIYREYQASWALWLYKDIGLQGVVFAAADSPYMLLLKDFLAKKARLGRLLGRDGRPHPRCSRSDRVAARPRVPRLQPVSVGAAEVGRAAAAPHPYLRGADTGIRRAVLGTELQ